MGGAQAGTPHKSVTSSGLAAPGSVLKSGLPPPSCLLSPSTGGTKACSKPATPLSIPRLAKSDGVAAKEKEGEAGGEGRWGRMRYRTRSSVEDSENVPVQLG
jgi:hypothetical protein